LDGTPLGRPFLGPARDRPVLELPSRKRARVTFDLGDDDEAGPLENPLLLEAPMAQAVMKDIIGDEEEEQEDEDEDDYYDPDESDDDSSESSDGEEENEPLKHSDSILSVPYGKIQAAIPPPQTQHTPKKAVAGRSPHSIFLSSIN